MIGLLIPLAVSAAGIIWFIVKDAIRAFDGDPTTPTLSSKIKGWRHHGHTGGRTLLLAMAIIQLFGTPAVYLLGHLVGGKG